jgi:phosphatidylinositol glycan class A protein
MGWDVYEVHEQVKGMYSWNDVAKRTERVYHKVIQSPDLSLGARLRKYHNVGVVAGKISMMIMAVDFLILLLLDWLLPADRIDLCPRFESDLFMEHCIASLEKESTQ